MLRSLLFALCVTLVPALLKAQSVDLNLAGAGVTVPLLDTVPVRLDNRGRWTLNCVLQGSTCQGLGSGATNGGPTVTLLRLNGGGTVPVGGTVVMGWAVQGMSRVCLARSTPLLAGWNSNNFIASGGSTTFVATAAGTYTLTMRCYSDDGQSNLATFVLVVGSAKERVANTVLPIQVTRTSGAQTGVCQSATAVSFAWQALYGRYSMAYTCASDASQTTRACPVQSLAYEPAAPGAVRRITVNCNWVAPPMFASGFE